MKVLKPWVKADHTVTDNFLRRAFDAAKDSKIYAVQACALVAAGEADDIFESRNLSIEGTRSDEYVRLWQNQLVELLIDGTYAHCADARQWYIDQGVYIPYD